MLQQNKSEARAKVVRKPQRITAGKRALLS